MLIFGAVSTSTMAEKYFIQQYLGQHYQHGGAGLVDAERILLNEGYRPLVLPHQQSFSWLAKGSRLFSLFKIVLRVRKGADIVFLYPGYARLAQLLVRLLLRYRKDTRLICFLTDIDGIKDGDDGKLKKEISFFKRLKYFIVHNERMKQWLNENVGGVQSVETDFFDFLASPSVQPRTISPNIVFAGNLSKSQFLEQMGLIQQEQPDLHFDIYGPHQTLEMLAQPNLSWHGVDDPYGLPQKLKGSFGLLWDGTSIRGMDGSIGRYMKYISHHKLSLYILSGLPIIVPAASAGEYLVKKYKIGVAVNNISGIEEAINALSEDQYQQMRKNMQPLAKKISTGGCLKDALQKLLAGN